MRIYHRSKLLKGWFEFWWIRDSWREGRMCWQIMGHIFQDTMLETVWEWGRYCGKGITNTFIYLDLWRKQCFSPFLNWLLR